MGMSHDVYKMPPLTLFSRKKTIKKSGFIFEKEISYRCIPHRMPFEADEPFSLLFITDFLHLF